MSMALVTGSAGLIGSETCKRFHSEGLDIAGIDNDMRARFFGPEASTRRQLYPPRISWKYAWIEKLFRLRGCEARTIILLSGQVFRAKSVGQGDVFTRSSQSFAQLKE